ncbi:hypothetical protein BRADI_4g05280v3 [Brachypodium distachyon]|uniref:Uncharacterized protein n=2 Tax=Brachypodium distachyon TaxID=15368 RepID=A0A0Q3IJK5_BRADI|nr:hypothetical protein BRADI_4g05280v3 [Brachypodium distachyon]
MTWLVQQLVYAVVFCGSIFVLYLSGLLITTGVSLWRLIQHDYDGDPDKANMNPALDVLYSLVVIQGVIYVYGKILWYMRKRIVSEVANKYGFEGQAIEIVSEYFDEIQNGCNKDPSFAIGKNLITYAVDLMGSNKSAEEYCSATRMLGTFAGAFSCQESEKFDAQRRLIKQLIGSPSSSHILQKLLRTLNWRSRPYDREMKEYAARIVGLVADEIQSEQVIQHTSSLIGTFEEYHEPPSHSNTDDTDIPKEENYKEMLLHGLHILSVLAAVDENNCRVISDTKGLLPKIMAPLTSDLIHQADHCAWSDVVKGSLEVMLELTAAPGKTGAKLRQEISINNEAISTMVRILKCSECNGELKVLTFDILRQLCMDTESSEDFIMMLVDTYTVSNKHSFDRQWAGEALARMLSFQGVRNYAAIILHANGDVVDSLVTELIDFYGYSIREAKILEHPCINYTKDDEHTEKLKEAMTNLMPKVLSEILRREATQTGADRPGFSQLNEDIEDPHGGASQDDDHNKSSTSCRETQEQHKYRKSQSALLSLCVTVCDTFISEDQDLALHIDAIESSSLPSKLVVRNSDPTASCLGMLKVTSRMVISMMKHRGSYPKQDLDSLVKVLFTASRSMLLVDGSTVFAREDDGAPMKPARTLASLVKEAQELVGNYRSEESEIMVPSTCISGES